MSFKNPDRLKKKKNIVRKVKHQTEAGTEKVSVKAKKPKNNKK